MRAVDSSLLDEWERIRDPGQEPAAAPATDEPAGEADVTTDARGFTVLVRNAMFQLLRALARRDWQGAVELATGLSSEEMATSMGPFFAEHAAIRLDPAARAPDRTRIEPGDGTWSVVQVISDPEGDDDWAVFASIDLASSAKEGRPVVRLSRLGR